MDYDPADMTQLPHLSASSEHYFNTTSAAAYQATHPLPSGHGHGHGPTSFLAPAHAPSSSGSGVVPTSTGLDGVPPYSLSISHSTGNGNGNGLNHDHIAVNGNGNGNSNDNSKADRAGSSAGAIGVPRPPRSRKNRPCDHCRKAKSRCAIGASGPPCSQCSETRKNCTFELAPPVRKPRLQPTPDDGSGLGSGLGLGSDDVGGLAMGGRDGDTPTRSPSISTPTTTTISRRRPRPRPRPRPSSARSSSVSSEGSESSGDVGTGTASPVESGRARARARARMSESVSASTPQERPSRARDGNENGSGGSGPGLSKKAKTKDRRDTNLSGLDVLAAAVPSFDHLANSEYDPHVLTVVLTDDLLPISDPREDGEKSHVKQISSDPARPIFVVMNPKTDTSQQPVPGAVSLAHLRTFLRHHPSHLPESHLISLYHTHVHPALPILPNNPTASQTPQLLATVLVTSLSHSKDTRSLAAPAAGLLNLGMQGLEENNLSGVASAVLELGMRPINSSRASYLLLAKTVAQAQLLGMHMNPLKWAIPRWEQDLRIRLWWILAMHDAWMSFLNSRPCLMQAHNNSVPLPSLAAVLEASCAHSSASSDSAKAFITSCRLANLVRRLQRDVCTLGAVADRSTRERRDGVVELARRADELFGEWKGSASEGQARPTGVVSLLVHLLGFRCMLKRILIELDHGLGAMFTPDAEVLAPFNDCVGFIAQLSEAELDGYFLNYASHIISSVTSSLIRLSLASPSSSTNCAMDLLSRLVRALHGFQTTSGWDIASPALRRAAAVENKLKSLGEHDQLLRALRGGITQSPLDVMAAVEAIATTAVPEASEMEPQFVWDWSGMDWDFGSLLGGTNVA